MGWMQPPRYDIYQPDEFGMAPLRWIDGYGDPVRAAKRRSFLRLVVIACGALCIMAASFAAVAAYELFTSEDAKLVAQAAKDRTRATTLAMSTDAKCDRLVSEARAAGQPLPSCAEQSPPQESASTGSGDEFDMAAIVETIIKAAAD
jgi:hypothetical protein